MACDRIHHNGECEDVTTHHENKEDNLCGSEYFPADWASHNFSCVRHVMHSRVGELELSDHVARICCKDAQASNEDDTTA